MDKLIGILNRVLFVPLLYFIFILMWCYIFWGIKELFSLGFHTAFEDAYGRWSIWFGFGAVLLVLLSPIYLHKYIKKEIFIAIISIFCSIMLVTITFFTYSIAYEQFSEFTPDKWQKYERQRLIMLDDMRTNHISDETTKNKILELLGIPDEITEDGYLKYNYGEYGYITVFVDGEYIKGVEATDKFGKHY